MRRRYTPEHLAYDLSYGQKMDVVESVQEAAKDVASWVKLAYMQGVQNTLEQMPSISALRKQEIIKAEQDSLLIEVYDTAPDIRRRLSDFEMLVSAESVRGDHALLVIRLPAPIENWEQARKDAVWKQVYFQNRHVIWDHLRRALKDNHLQAERLNAVGNHKNGEFFYLFLLSPTGSEPVTEEYV